MPSSGNFNLTIDPPGAIEQMRANLASAPSWMPEIYKKSIKRLAPKAQKKFRLRLSAHHYRGTLENSVKIEYKEAGLEAWIAPDAKRGKWNAGLILEFGTKPIPNAPWSPIKEWADFRGSPAFPVWFGIRTRGVTAHPWFDDAVGSFYQADLAPEIKWLMGQLINRAFQGFNIVRG